jgi:Cu/Ag efflux protein CusF
LLLIPPMKKRTLDCRPAILALAVGVSALTALAQSSGRPDAADPKAPVPALKHESVFSGYQAYQEPQLAPWKEVLDRLASTPARGHAGMDHKAAKDEKEGMAAHGAAAGGGQAGSTKPKQAAPASGRGVSKGHEHMAMAKPRAPASIAKPAEKSMDRVNGTGVIREIDNAKGRIKISHEPIDALGWPGITLFFRLKDGVRADQVQEGEKVGFTLERSASGYVISEFHPPMSGKDKKADHHATRGGPE